MHIPHFSRAPLAFWQHCHATNLHMIFLFSNINQLTALLSQDVPNHLGHAERRIFMFKNAVFLLLIMDWCQSDCFLHNQWLRFILVQFKEDMTGLKYIRRSYHSQIEKTSVGWQVHVLDMLYTRSANRTRLQRKKEISLLHILNISTFAGGYLHNKQYFIISMFKTGHSEKDAANPYSHHSRA